MDTFSSTIRSEIEPQSHGGVAETCRHGCDVALLLNASSKSTTLGLQKSKADSQDQIRIVGGPQSFLRLDGTTDDPGAEASWTTLYSPAPHQFCSFLLKANVPRENGCQLLEISIASPGVLVCFGLS